MKTQCTITVIFLVLFLVLPGTAKDKHVSGSLNILLTNDDGYESEGIHILRDKLTAAGHNVTVVAPLDNQSGKGGAVTSNIGGFVDVIEQSPGVWSVDGTPVDTVYAALGAVLANNPPDLILSGMNFGQNLGQPSSHGSGTIGAAINGLFRNIPAISLSVGIDISKIGSVPDPAAAILEAMPPAADFTVRLIEKLQQTSHDGRILPLRTMLNVNFPAPYDEINGVKVTRLAQIPQFQITWEDVLGVIPNGGGPVLISIKFNDTSEEPVKKADTRAFTDSFITITIMDGNMTARSRKFNQLKHRLFHLSIY